MSLVGSLTVSFSLGTSRKQSQKDYLDRSLRKTAMDIKQQWWEDETIINQKKQEESEITWPSYFWKQKKYFLRGGREIQLFQQWHRQQNDRKNKQLASNIQLVLNPTVPENSTHIVDSIKNIIQWALCKTKMGKNPKSWDQNEINQSNFHNVVIRLCRSKLVAR